MCLASITAASTHDAAEGETVHLRLTPNGQPYFHTKGYDPNHVTCIKHGARLVVSGLTAKHAEQVGLPTEFEGVFVEDPGDQSDFIWLGKDHFITLYDLLDRRDSVSIEHVGPIKSGQLDEFARRCNEYFTNEVDWNVPGNWGYSVAAEDRVLRVDRLPAIVRPDGKVEYPETTPHAEVSAPPVVLEDA